MWVLSLAGACSGGSMVSRVGGLACDDFVEQMPAVPDPCGLVHMVQMV